jgi:hypothetical protein
MGDVGKKQLAYDYAREFSGYYGSRLWIDATKEQDILGGYQEISRKLAQKKREEVSDNDKSGLAAMKYVRAWLEESQEKDWLTVFDNVDEYSTFKEDICTYLPNQGKGRILITTRRTDILLGKRLRVDSNDTVIAS